jgi:hypothetical protein
LGADCWEKIAQIEAEAVDEGKGDPGKTLRAINVFWKS